MSESQAQVSVRILDKEYQIACPVSERTDLLDSAEILNSRMQEIRDGGRIVGLDRIAVMAALNIANEFINSSKSLESTHGVVSQKVTELTERVGRALSEQKQLNL